MARAWRIEYPRALYHVFSRGNERRPIVAGDPDRTLFLDLLGQMCGRFEMEVYAYVLMDNHYHWLLRTLQANLSRGLQWFGSVYTSRFNFRHRRSGHLFQGRFKSFLIEDDSYLMTLSCYIHRNPLRAGLVKRLANYAWSSYPAYAYGQHKPAWLKEEVILSQLMAKDRRRAYRQKVQQYAKEEGSLWEDVRHGLFMGSDEFIQGMTQATRLEHPDPERPQQRQALRTESLEALLQKVAKGLKCDVGILRQSGRGRGGNTVERDLCLYWLWDQGRHTNAEIGAPLGLTYSAVSRRVAAVRTRLGQDSQARARYNELKSQIKV